MVWQALDASQYDEGVFIDAATTESLARFVNHSITPNMTIRHRAFAGTSLQPWSALVTTEPVPGNTELDLNYGADFVIPPLSFVPPTPGVTSTDLAKPLPSTTPLDKRDTQRHAVAAVGPAERGYDAPRLLMPPPPPRKRSKAAATGNLHITMDPATSDVAVTLKLGGKPGKRETGWWSHRGVAWQHWCWS